MTQHTPFDDLDLAALRKLDSDVTIADKTAAIDNIEAEIVRIGDMFELHQIPVPINCHDQARPFAGTTQPRREQILMGLVQDEDPEFTANGKRNRKLLARRLRANGFIRHAYGFWLAPGAAPKVPSDESDEANERKPA